MTRSHRNEDRGGEHRWTFNGVEYPTRKLMCEARRAEYVRLLDEEGDELHPGRARGRRLETHRQGVAQRQDARHGKERETPGGLVSFHHGQTQTLHPRYLSQEERIQIADRLRLGDSIRAIARLLGRDPGTVSREVERQQESPSPAVTSLTAPSRRPRTGSNAPNRARRPRARDCGTRSPPGCAGIGARSR